MISFGCSFFFSPTLEILPLNWLAVAEILNLCLHVKCQQITLFVRASVRMLFFYFSSSGSHIKNAVGYVMYVCVCV